MKALIVFCAAVLLAGCGKKDHTAPAAATETAPAPTKAAATGESPAPIAEADVSKATARLTQALRKYSAETRSVPKSLNDLVAAGYLDSMPEAPPGKKFVFDDQLRVTVK